MSLTEVAFEVADSSYPMCGFTAKHPGTRCIYRIMDFGSASRVFRATITILGPSELSGTLVRELRMTRRYDEFEILSITPYALLLRIGHEVPTARDYPGIALRPVELFLESFGRDALLEPFIIEGGRIRIRAIVPQPLDTKQTLVRLQEIQRGMAWDHFRVLRVAEFKAVRYADELRRLLVPEQEDLLRLALSLGYYTSPKGCTLEDIAKKLSLSVSPVHKRLKVIEQTLVNAYVDPTSVTAPDPRRRPARGGVVPLWRMPTGTSTASMFEIALRTRWSAFAPSAFVARHPGTRAVFQPLVEDGRAGIASALLVLIAPTKEYRDLLEAYERNDAVAQIEVISKDADHVSVKLRTRMPAETGWSAHPNPFPRLVQKFGREAFLRPVLLEGEEAWLKFVVMRGVSEETLNERLKAAMKEARWEAYEVLAVRRLEMDPAATSIPPPEKMTPRQEEILKISHALGYYKTPRECTLEEVASTLGISANAIHKNLTAAEHKIISNYLSAGS